MLGVWRATDTSSVSWRTEGMDLRTMLKERRAPRCHFHFKFSREVVHLLKIRHLWDNTSDEKASTKRTDKDL